MVEEARPIEMPRPLAQLTESEILRRILISKVMTHVLRCLTNEFLREEFEWLLPVIFSPSTDPLWPDSDASIEKRIQVEIYGKPVKATLSMIVHKMITCSLVHPKLFILSPNIRVERTERANTGIHVYEFTQLDFECQNATSDEIMSFVEKIVTRLINYLKTHARQELTLLGRYDNLSVPERPFRIYDGRELERRHGRTWETLLAHRIDDPVWVTNIPREFYDFEDFETGKWDNYDLLLPKYGEVLSGARREWKHSKILRKMERDNVEKGNYRTLLQLAKQRRLKPSAGAGIGLERLTAWIVGAKHVGETQLFPKIPGIVYDL